MYMYVCMYVCMYVFMYVSALVCMYYGCMYVSICTYMYLYLSICMYGNKALSNPCCPLLCHMVEDNLIRVAKSQLCDIFTVSYNL